MNITGILEMVAGASESGICVAPGGRTLLLAEVMESASRGARAVRDQRATAVLYVGASHEALAVSLFAAAWAGVPFVPLNYRMSSAQLADLLAAHPGAVVLAERPGDVPATGAVGFDEWLASISSVEPLERWDDDEDEVAVLLYTSGTTAAPKAVVLRHRHLTSYVLGTVEFLGSGPDEAALVSVPPYHIAGVANLLSNVFAGRRVVYLPTFSASDWLDVVAKEQATHAMVVPTMLARIVEELDRRGEPGPASLRTLSYGGARTPRRVIEQALALFPTTDFVNAYGLTETSSTLALLGPEDHRLARDGDEKALERLGSVGRVLSGVEVSVVDADGRELGPGEVGEIRVRGPQVSGEYLGRGSLLDVDGWFPTRDLGWLDEEGYLFIQGRGDDTIIRGGENIAPATIEDVLRAHPGVADVAVVGVPDDEWGQRLAAVVVPTADGLDVEDLRAFARERLRSSLTPESFVVRDELPYTPTGKLLRRLVLDELVASAG